MTTTTGKVEQRDSDRGIRIAQEYLLKGAEYYATHPTGNNTNTLLLSCWVWPGKGGPACNPLRDLVKGGVSIGDIATACQRIQTQKLARVEVIGGTLEDIGTLLQEAYELRIVPGRNTSRLTGSVAIRSNSLVKGKSGPAVKRCPWDLSDLDLDGGDADA